MNDHKPKDQGKETLTLVSPSLWSSQGHFCVKAANSVTKKKKISFTPQPTTSSTLPDDLDIMSFDEVVLHNSKEPITTTKSTEISNNNLLGRFKIFDEEYLNIVNSIFSFTHKKTKQKSYKNLDSCVGALDNSSESNSITPSSEEEEEKQHQKEEMQKMTNIQEISDFNEYTYNCMELIDEMNSLDILNLNKYPITKEREIILPFVDKIGRGKGQKRLAIFDLDETLIHCELNPDNSAQTKIEVVLPNKTTKEIGLNIRPHWKEELLKIKTKYYLIMYTASHHSYADSVLNYLDPKKEIFDLRLYRNNCTIVNYEGKTFYIKDLRILKDVSLKDMVIIDNSVLSFAFHLDNGIPILPYYHGEEGIEMQNLSKLLLKLSECDDIKLQLHNIIELREHRKKRLKKANKSKSGLLPRQAMIKSHLKKEVGK